MTHRLPLLLIASGLAALLAAAGLSAADPHWPGFRGPAASGVADGAPLPESWDVPAGKGLAWKTPLPGLGHASPVVWGNRLFVTTAVSGDPSAGLRVGLYGDITPVRDDTPHEFQVYCLDARSGKVLWTRTAHRGVPRIQRHAKATHANCTMAVDARNAVAFFGSEGLYCYDHDGKLRWKKDLGVLDAGFFLVPTAQWGFASSPVIYRDRVIVQCDIQQGGFLAAFRLSDGQELWRTPRQDVPTWSTPAVVTAGGRTQVVVNGWKHLGGYDVETGRELWRLTGGGDIPVPTPVFGHGLIFLTNAHGRMAPIYAVRPGASGDITPEGEATVSPGIAWSTRRDGAYMQTPLVYGDHLYVCRDNGLLGCYEATTGNRLYYERLGSGRTGFTASGVAANGRLYYTSEEGEVFVVRAGPRFEVLGTHPLGEVCLATPALSRGRLYFRTQKHVMAIGK